MEDPDAGIRRMAQHWAGRRPDLDTRPLALFGRLSRADTLAGAAITAALRAHRLSRGEFDLLTILHRDDGPQGLSPGALASSMLLSPAATTNRVDRLEAAGLLTRAPDPADGRAVRVRLTPGGRAVVDDAVNDHVRGMERLLSDLSPAERERLSGLLARLLHSIARGGSTPSRSPSRPPGRTR